MSRTVTDQWLASVPETVTLPLKGADGDGGAGAQLLMRLQEEMSGHPEL